MWAEEQSLQQQVTSLTRRFEMFKVTMTMEVKDLEHQLEGMRQSTRQRIADSAAELESHLKDRVLRQMHEDVVTEVSGQILPDMAQQLQQLSQSVKDDIKEVEQKLAQMRKSLMEDFVDLGQRPVFDFMQSVQGNLRQEMAELKGELNDLRAHTARGSSADASRQLALPSPTEVAPAGAIFEVLHKIYGPAGSPHPGDFGGLLAALPGALLQQQQLRQEREQQQQGCACRPPELTGAEIQQAAACPAPDGLAPPTACPSFEPLLRCLEASHASLQQEITSLDQRLRAAQAGREGAGGAGWRPHGAAAAAGASGRGAEASHAAAREDEASSDGATPLGAPAVAVAAEWLGAAPGRGCSGGGLLVTRHDGARAGSLASGSGAASPATGAGAEGFGRSGGSAADAKASPAPSGQRKAP